MVKKMNKKILTIGPVTKDKNITPTDSYNQIGGSAYYISNVLSQLNEGSTSIISIGKDDLELTSEFDEEIDLKIIEYDKTMEYTNTYNDKDKRVQKAVLPENPITPEKIESLDLNLSEYEYAIIAPLSQSDIPLETVKYLHENKIKTVIVAQGYLRTIDKDNNVITTTWDDIEDYLDYIDIIRLL